jgi:phosphoribosylaminoimidazole carboxylase (NCAIR synthetase)
MAVEINQEIIDALYERAFELGTNITGFNPDIIALQKVDGKVIIMYGDYNGEYGGYDIEDTSIIKVEDLSLEFEEIRERRKKELEEKQRQQERQAKINVEKNKLNRYQTFLNLKVEYEEINEVEYYDLLNKAVESFNNLVVKF